MPTTNLRSSERNSKRSNRRVRSQRNLNASRSFKLVIWFVMAIVLVVWLSMKVLPSNNRQVEFATEQRYIWQVRSIDTMKNSRDQARARLYDQSYAQVIENEARTIKELGANYIALGTPYDEEFMPYLKRWVGAARKNGLNVWYRGTFSAYEGWFEYPKTMSPEELLEASEKFIIEHPFLFEDGDIFDACPECENAGHWPQPYADSEYNAFIQKKHQVLSDAFKKIDKDVNVSYASIIGGRAKDVMDQASFDTLGNVVALDHYAVPPSNYGEYVRYFWDKHQTKVLFSEVGAPIPDLHGDMTDQEQADFMRQVFEELYANKEQVIGVNYWVYNNGTTAMAEQDGTLKSVASVIEDYFQPGFIKGRVTTDLGDGVAHAEVKLDGSIVTQTTSSGYYFVAVPKGQYQLTISHPDHSEYSKAISLGRNQELKVQAVVEPIHKDWRYKLREKFHLTSKF